MVHHSDEKFLHSLGAYDELGLLVVDHLAELLVSVQSRLDFVQSGLVPEADFDQQALAVLLVWTALLAWDYPRLEKELLG